MHFDGYSGHSILYSLGSKEKLEGKIGLAAEASLVSMYAESGHPWPKLVQLALDERRLTYFEGDQIAQGAAASLLAKVGGKVDLISDSWERKCITDEKLGFFSKGLRPGGMVIVQGLSGCFPRQWQSAIKSLTGAVDTGALEYFFVGRNIFFAVASGSWKPRPTASSRSEL